MNNQKLIKWINKYKINTKKSNKHYPFLYFINFFDNTQNINNITEYLIEIINIYNNKQLIINTENNIQNELIQFTKDLYLSEENDIEDNIQLFAYFFKYLINKNNKKLLTTNSNQLIICKNNSNQSIFKITNEDIYYFLQNILYSNYKQHKSFTLFPIFKKEDIKKIIITLIQNYNGIIDNVSSIYTRNYKNIYDIVYRIYTPFPLSFYITKNKIIKLANCIDFALVNNKINIFFSVNNLIENETNYIKSINDLQLLIIQKTHNDILIVKI